MASSTMSIAAGGDDMAFKQSLADGIAIFNQDQDFTHFENPLAWASLAARDDAVSTGNSNHGDSSQKTKLKLRAFGGGGGGKLVKF